MKSIAIIVLNYKGWMDTLECIESLQSQSYLNWRIIIIDNNSEDESVDKFHEWANGNLEIKSVYFRHKPHNEKKTIIEYDVETALQGGITTQECLLDNVPANGGIVIISSKNNLGFSGGNNIGAKYAEHKGYDYVLFLNNDTVIIDKDFLQKLIEPFNMHPSIYATGPSIINFDGTFDGPYIEDTFLGNLLYLPLLNIFRKLLKSPAIYINNQAISSPKPIPVYKISGACMMFASHRIKEIEYLDENVWLSCEEAIISEKVKLRNGKIYLQPLTTLIHKKAKSPRPKTDKINILKNHYKQRAYFNRTYRKYGILKMGTIKFVNNLRICAEMIKK